eukprot:436665_1
MTLRNRMKTVSLCIIMVTMVTVSENQNMNGEYLVASGATQNVNFNTDYASKANEYFDIWAPEIATHYGDVFWTSQGTIPLPNNIVKRFAGKVIAITGYEQDQVMVQPSGEPGVNPDKDVSVPINWAYNHHYMLWVTGNYSTMAQVPTTDEDIWYNHGQKYKWVAKPLESAELRSDTSIPVSQLFSEGNGGESRKSFHGYPKGYAQLIESPQSYNLLPMQVDTRNRDCGVTINDVTNSSCGDKFIPGIEPIQSRYGRGIPKDTNYSGLLECPCDGKFGGDPIFYGTNTKTKVVTHNYVTLQSTQCTNGETIVSANTCFAAVANMEFLPDTKIVNKTIKDISSIPVGCTITEDTENNIIYAYYNAATTSKNKCSISNIMNGSTISEVNVKLSLSLDTSVGNITFIRSPPGEWCSDNLIDVLEKFPTASNNETDQVAALNKCESYCKTSTQCNVCSVDCPPINNKNGGQCQWVAIPKCGQVMSFKGPNGVIEGDISRKSTSGLINMIVSGPSDVWFSVGFNAREMADQPYALIINSTNVWEQKIGTCGSEADHCPGNTLNKTINLMSNTVTNNVRTVILQRDAIGATSDYYSFVPNQQATVDLITAIGESQTFAYHKAHSNTEISLIMSTGKTCVCDTGANGKLCQNDGTECEQFTKLCVSAAPVGSKPSVPDGSLVVQDNPTCNSRQYSGGLRCCRNGKNLLDANQTIPSSLLRYHMKFRFWFQEYYPANNTNDNKPSHYNLPRIYQQTEANAGEYDIPPAFALPNVPVVGYPNWPLNEPTPGTVCSGNCPNGNDCECIHEIHYKWIENPTKPMRLIYAGGHCHAPMCQSLILYRNDTGEILCSQIPQYGKGNIDKDKYDEAGYILIPPCLWGNDTGLEPSVLLPPGTPLLSKKICKNTHMGHY